MSHFLNPIRTCLETIHVVCLVGEAPTKFKGVARCSNDFNGFTINCFDFSKSIQIAFTFIIFGVPNSYSFLFHFPLVHIFTFEKPPILEFDEVFHLFSCHDRAFPTIPGVVARPGLFGISPDVAPKISSSTMELYLAKFRHVQYSEYFGWYVGLRRFQPISGRPSASISSIHPPGALAS